MLVLARKVEQSILLDGGKIRISVLEVQGGRVKLGIEAPKEIAVQREPAGGRPDPPLLSVVRRARMEAGR